MKPLAQLEKGDPNPGILKANGYFLHLGSWLRAGRDYSPSQHFTRHSSSNAG